MHTAIADTIFLDMGRLREWFDATMEFDPPDAF